MIVKSSEFLKSSPDVSICPPPEMPGYGFIGRSNVGKSSLINMLMGRKDLARISNTPGKTQTINHYIINENWYLVDLPGYGFSKVSKDLRAKWDTTMRNYMLNRPNLQCVFQLIDSRVPPQKNDLNFTNWLGYAELPFVLVFTKTDKQNPIKTAENVELYKIEILKFWDQSPDIFLTSSETKQGKEEILTFIDGLSIEFYEEMNGYN